MLDTLTRLVPLDQADHGDVERLLDDAFGLDRHARTAYRLRAGVVPIPELSFAAFDSDDALVGSLQCWPIELATPEGLAVPLVLVGPVAVDPSHQRRGLGREMMTLMLATADANGTDPEILIGDPEYYGRFFGFTAEATGQWELPGPFERHRLLARTGGRILPQAGMLGPRK